MKQIMVVGGGSAGHVLPAIAVVRILQRQGYQVSFVGSRSGLEEKLLADVGIEYHAIATGKLRRYWSWQNLLDVFRIAAGVVQSIWLLLRKRPAVVFSKGGFVSFPLVCAAWLVRIPVVAHESDLTPGLANRLVLPLVDTLCTSFAETRAPGRAKIVHTGSPVRAELLAADPRRGRQLLAGELYPEPDMMTDQSAAKPLLVITGGSLGAEFLNQVVNDALPALTEHFLVLHVCGAGKRSDRQLPGYHQVDYVGEGWGDILAAADLVVSRAGANTLFELLALGKLNLLVPLSAAVSRGDQVENAAYAQQHGYSMVIEEQNLSPQSLLENLQLLLQQRQAFSAQLEKFNAPAAAEKIAAQITAHIQG